ncbi:MAG: DUF2110 family protein [Candidatus Bathyarchaeota archaeon]|nr:DUF2110 family protein [Candidatus Bathyarchaeota archaeon]
MTALTLMVKIYNSHQLKQIDPILSDLLGDLNVEVKVVGTAAGKWVQLEVSGEDETIATKLLEREAGGFCPVSVENVKKFSNLKGYVTGLDKNAEALVVDVGVFEPNTVPAVVSLSRLQKHLTNGEKTTLKKMAELWGISENLPLELKVLEVNAQENLIEADLQPTQTRKLLHLKDSLIDRLIIIGASREELNVAVAQAGLSRDVIDVETLGMFEHALVYKLGTDAAGLIGRVGRRLRKANFTVFNPKKTFAFLNSVTNANAAPKS